MNKQPIMKQVSMNGLIDINEQISIQRQLSIKKRELNYPEHTNGYFRTENGYF